MYVERAGERFLAEWIEYAVGTGTRTHVGVLEYQRTLIPRGAVAVGLQASRYDLSEDEARAWLADAGYRVVLAVG